MRSPLSLLRMGSVGVVLLLALGLKAQAQNTHDLLWSPNLSARAGATTLSTAYRGPSALEDRYLPLRWTQETTFLGKTLGVSYRLARFVTIDSPLAYMTTLAQHEVFGHGASIRHVGRHADGYVLRLPFPYGSGGGLTRLPTGEQFALQEDLWLRANGMNANLLLAQSVRNRAVHRGHLHYTSALLGLAGHLDLPLYVWGTQEESASPSNDVTNYVSRLGVYDDQKTPRRYDASDRLDALKRQARASLLDPFAWLSFWTVLRDYLWRGTGASSLWTLSVGPVRYLPSLHLSLAPFGTEILLEHLVVHQDRLWALSMRQGNGPWGRFGGLGLEVDPVATTGHLHLTGRVNVWYQPKLVFDETQLPSESLPRTLGGRIEATAAVRPSPNWPVSAVGTLGYKTTGFVLGEPLADGVLAELGLRLHVNLFAAFPPPDD